MFQGLVPLGGTATVSLLVTNSSKTPINADALPTYRVYGPDGLLDGQTGSVSFRDSGSVTDATNASPIVITSTAHGLTTGARVTVASVGGNTAANGTFLVTRINDDTFSLDGSTGNGAYTSGGTWNATGLYAVTLTCSEGNGYAEEELYQVLFSCEVSTVDYADLASFQVV